MQFLLKTLSKKFIKNELNNIGFDNSYVDVAVNKHIFLSIKIFNLRPAIANILKQTALSSMCDCAVHKGVIDCSVDKSDCILSGTISELINVSNKLKNQPFSLSFLSDEILNLIQEELKPKKTKIMGIVNVTNNSFSDGGEYFEFDKAINHAIDLIEQGADIIDIGAQSTKPMADIVGSNLEMEKVIPIVIALKNAYPNILLSIDTFCPDCALASINAGADIINDVSFLNDIELIKMCAKYDKKLVIMHSRGDSKTMDKLNQYNNLIDDIYCALKQKIDLCASLGLKKENIIADVGFGFAKNYSQNFELLSRINEFKSLGVEILAGVSRKRFLQDAINTKEPKDADIQTLLATSWFIQNGIDYVRVHNVELTSQAFKFNDKLFANLV